MALNSNGTLMTRVQANGTYIKTVVSNGVIVFNLTTWSFVGATGGAVVVSFAGTLTVDTGFTSTGFTLCNQATSTAGSQGTGTMNNSFPIQNYGGGAFGQITIWEVRNAFGQLARCVIDFGFPPLRYQVVGQYL
jgi:hypothetical protein